MAGKPVSQLKLQDETKIIEHFWNSPMVKSRHIEKKPYQSIKN
jgi:hypothetical protein